MSEAMKNVVLARNVILGRIKNLQPRVAIVLGSGLGSLGEKVTDAIVIPYKEIPGFPHLSVQGHAGNLIAGRLAGRDVLCLQGRVHSYEGNDFTALKNMIRTVKAVGAGTLFLTSASGSPDKDMKPGAIMAIADHINLMGVNPLVGPNDADFGPRFVDMKNVWDADLRRDLKKAAAKAKIDLPEGVFAAFRGPNFETPAEVRMAQIMGAKAVGMSSVPECLIARHCDLKVMGCAVITNLAAGMSDENLSHEHTLAQAKLAEENLTRLVLGFLEAQPQSVAAA